MEYITKCRSHGFTCRKRVLAEFAQNSNNRNSFHVLLLFFVKYSLLLLLLVVKHVQHLHAAHTRWWLQSGGGEWFV